MNPANFSPKAISDYPTYLFYICKSTNTKSVKIDCKDRELNELGLNTGSEIIKCKIKGVTRGHDL